MGKGAALRWIENRYLRTYLHGRGVEIGGLWRKFRVPSNAKVYYVDRLSAEDLAKHYAEVNTGFVAPDVVADAESLPLRGLDFIIASHVFEHLPHPLKALKSWYEALRSGGSLLLKVPDKRFTFDHKRERTPLKHLIEEYEDPDSIDERAHYAEWVELVNGKAAHSAEFEQELRALMEQNYSIHYHAWIDRDLEEIIDYGRITWHLDWKPVVFWDAHFYRKETVIVLRKS
jgi:SAM-dependent methyltransferase